MQKLYSIYDDNKNLFLAKNKKGEVWLTKGKGYYRDSIGRWSLSKAKALIKKYKTLRWHYPESSYENGNPTRKSLRLLRVYSEEWSELTGIRNVHVKIGKTVLASAYYDW